MDIRAIFFDVDGTLVDPKTHQMPQSAIDTVMSLQKEGYVCVIATGRPYENMKTTAAFQAVKWDGYICCNGQQVVDKEGNFIYQETFCEQRVKEVLALGKQLGHPLCCMSDKKWFMTCLADSNTIEAMQFLQIPIPMIEEYDGQNILSFICFADKGYDYKPYMELGGLRVNPSYVTYADIGLAGTSKAKAITIFLKYHGLEGYIAFGDSMNDYDMLENADVAIAMGQGDSRLQTIADYVTKAVDDDGILYAYKNYDCFK